VDWEEAAGVDVGLQWLLHRCCVARAATAGHTHGTPPHYALSPPAEKRLLFAKGTRLVAGNQLKARPSGDQRRVTARVGGDGVK